MDTEPRHGERDGDVQVRDPELTSLIAVRSAQIPELWPFVERMVTLCCERSNGIWRPVDIYERLCSADMQLWVFFSESNEEIKGIFVSEIEVYPSGLKALAGIFVTGRMREQWTHHKKDIEDWARQVGCKRVKLWARPGWEKEVRDYKRTHVLLEKEL